MTSVGRRIKIFRKAININQDFLAKKCEVSKRTVQAWEKDLSKITYDKIQILMTMGANPYFILIGKGEIMERKI